MGPGARMTAESCNGDVPRRTGLAWMARHGPALPPLPGAIGSLALHLATAGGGACCSSGVVVLTECERRGPHLEGAAGRPGPAASGALSQCREKLEVNPSPRLARMAGTSSLSVRSSVRRAMGVVSEGGGGSDGDTFSGGHAGPSPADRLPRRAPSPPPTHIHIVLHVPHPMQPLGASDALCSWRLLPEGECGRRALRPSLAPPRAVAADGHPTDRTPQRAFR